MNLEVARKILSDILAQQDQLSKQAILYAVKVTLDNLQEKEIPQTLGIGVAENIALRDKLS